VQREKERENPGAERDLRTHPGAVTQERQCRKRSAECRNPEQKSKPREKTYPER